MIADREEYINEKKEQYQNRWDYAFRFGFVIKFGLITIASPIAWITQVITNNRAFLFVKAHHDNIIPTSLTTMHSSRLPEDKSTKGRQPATGHASIDYT